MKMLKNWKNLIRTKSKIIKISAWLVVGAIAIMAFVAGSNSRNEVSEHVQHMSSNTLSISISTTGNRRVITINVFEQTGYFTVTQTINRSLRLRNDNPTITLPQRTVYHRGVIIEIYRIGNILIIHEISTGKRHYI